MELKTNTNVKSTVRKNLEKKKKQAPIPVRDISKFQAQEKLINFCRKGSVITSNTFHAESEEEEQTLWYPQKKKKITLLGFGLK